MTPLLRALAQLDDPALLGVLLQSLLLSGACFALLLGGSAWWVHGALAGHGAWAWLGSVAGAALAGLLGLWLFLPLAVVIAALLMDRVAAAVERRWYPGLPPPRGAALAVQAWDGLCVAACLLPLNLLALLLALLLPGPGWVLGWAITAWSLGRGLFVAVAMRRMGRAQAQAAYRARRGRVLLQGLGLALVGSVPGLNLLVPVVGTAAMVHLLQRPRGAARHPAASAAGESWG